MTFLYKFSMHVTFYNSYCMVIRRGCWPAKMLIIAPRSSGMLYYFKKSLLNWAKTIR